MVVLWLSIRLDVDGLMAVIAILWLRFDVIDRCLISLMVSDGSLLVASDMAAFSPSNGSSLRCI